MSMEVHGAAGVAGKGAPIAGLGILSGVDGASPGSSEESSFAALMRDVSELADPVSGEARAGRVRKKSDAMNIAGETAVQLAPVIGKLSASGHENAPDKAAPLKASKDKPAREHVQDSAIDGAIPAAVTIGMNSAVTVDSAPVSSGGEKPRDIPPVEVGDQMVGQQPARVETAHPKPGKAKPASDGGHDPVSVPVPSVDKEAAPIATLSEIGSMREGDALPLPSVVNNQPESVEIISGHSMQPEAVPDAPGDGARSAGKTDADIPPVPSTVSKVTASVAPDVTATPAPPIATVPETSIVQEGDAPSLPSVVNNRPESIEIISRRSMQPEAVPDARGDGVLSSGMAETDVPPAPPAVNKVAMPVTPVATLSETDRVQEGEATTLLSIAKTRAETAVRKTADPGVRPAETVEHNPPVAPVRGEGGHMPLGKLIPGIQRAADHAASHAAVVTRVANGSAPVSPVAADKPIPANESTPEFPAVPNLTTARTPAATAFAGTDASVESGRSSAEPSLPADDPRTEGALADIPPIARADGARGFGIAPLPANGVTVAVTGAHAPAGVSAASALDQQVIDMGVSGQWIEDIARQIASISANPGHGSFRIVAPSLGAVHVDITPGQRGSDILMTVDSEAAHAVLNSESDRLLQDARLASVRIGEVRVERAPAPADAPRGDMGNSQQQGGNGHSAAQGMMGQNAGAGGNPGGHQGGRPDASGLASQQQGGNNPKAPFTRTVLSDSTAYNEAEPAHGRRADTARYA